MKQKNVKYLVIIISLLIMTNCENSTEADFDSNERVVGSGRISIENRSIGSFTGVLIKNIGNVFVTQENSPSIKVEADDNIIKDVTTKVENGSLVISLANKSYSNITVHVYVSSPIIEKLLIEGAGNIVVEKPINTGKIQCAINGTGNISLKGAADEMTCTINGAGNINAFNFIVLKCTALINGVGNCEINVLKELIASITGTGNITFDGNPQTVSSSITGMGKIAKK
ncbi:MAG: DUF2807 domain-containing protein [Melioribacteraceae bacterium]|jgi:hypothetical protein|nr:DUF2807 domain-containing protein [Melioribacteraceae bacterium]